MWVSHFFLSFSPIETIYLFNLMERTISFGHCILRSNFNEFEYTHWTFVQQTQKIIPFCSPIFCVTKNPPNNLLFVVVVVLLHWWFCSANINSQPHFFSFGLRRKWWASIYIPLVEMEMNIFQWAHFICHNFYNWFSPFAI